MAAPLLLAAALLLAGPPAAGQAGIQAAPDAEMEIWRSFSRLRTEFGVPAPRRMDGLDEWARLNSRARAQGGSSPVGAEGGAAAAGLYFTSTKAISLDLPSLDLTQVREFFLRESSSGGRRLWPDLDAGGIGAVRDGGGRLHATVVLIHSLVPRPADEWRNILAGRIDAARRSGRVRRLAWKRRFHETAQRMAENGFAAEAEVRKLAESRLAEGIVFTTIDPAGPDFTAAEFNDPRIRVGGIGIWFGRGPGYPGGCYRLAVLLGGLKLAVD